MLVFSEVVVIVSSMKQWAWHAHSCTLGPQFKMTVRHLTRHCILLSEILNLTWNVKQDEFFFPFSQQFPADLDARFPGLPGTWQSGLCKLTPAGIKHKQTAQVHLSWAFGSSAQLCTGDLLMSHLPAWDCRGVIPRASKTFTASMPEVLQRKNWLLIKSNLILGAGTWLYHPGVLLVESKCYRHIV